MNLIPFDDRDGEIWVNGEFKVWRSAQTHVLNHGLHYGSCVFEGERAYNGVIFKSEAHTKRLFRSAEILDLNIPFTVEQIERAKAELLLRQSLKDAYLRVFAWRGSEMMAISAQKNKIHVAVAAWEWPSYFSAEQKKAGLRLDISKWRRPPPDSAPYAAKAAGLYMICTLSKHEAERKGYQDALMPDYRGFVSEATGANVFFVRDGALHTPTPDCFLNGITRQTIIELAKAENIAVIERHIRFDELNTFEECFLTGSAAEVTPVSQISDVNFSQSRLTERMSHLYNAAVQGSL